MPSVSRRLTMAGRRLPAILGPAESDTERTLRTATTLSSIWCARWRTVASSWGRVPGAAIASLAARRAAWFDVWPTFFETRALWGTIRGRISSRSGSDAGTFKQPAEWARRWPGRKSGAGQDRDARRIRPRACGLCAVSCRRMPGKERRSSSRMVRSRQGLEGTGKQPAVYQMDKTHLVVAWGARW